MPSRTMTRAYRAAGQAFACLPPAILCELVLREMPHRVLPLYLSTACREVVHRESSAACPCGLSILDRGLSCSATCVVRLLRVPLPTPLWMPMLRHLQNFPARARLPRPLVASFIPTLSSLRLCHEQYTHSLVPAGLPQRRFCCGAEEFLVGFSNMARRTSSACKRPNHRPPPNPAEVPPCSM